MKRFPFHRLKPTQAWITASLRYNPYSKMPPTVWHTISLDIEPLELGADAAMPEYEKVVESTILLAGLPIKVSHWQELDGTHTLGEDQDGSFYVSSAHNPVTVHELTLRHRGGARYEADATATFHFEFEGAGYADETTRLVFPAVHRGFTFCVPNWSEPKKMKFPAKWGIPSASSDWSPEMIREFAQRHFDLSQFPEITIEDGTLRATPLGSEQDGPSEAC